MEVVEKAKKIIDVCLLQKSKNSVEIFNNIAQMDFVAMHGPEHHILDGAALLTAYYNAGSHMRNVGRLRCGNFNGCSPVNY